MTLGRFNRMRQDHVVHALLECCGSRSWAEGMAALRPFATVEDVLAEAARVWLQLAEADWLQAFAAHPRIGEPAGSALSRTEQAAVYGAEERTRCELDLHNAEYERRFGFIFIVHAAGQSAEKLLGILLQRLHNTRDEEVANAATEQMKITGARLERLLTT